MTKTTSAIRARLEARRAELDGLDATASDATGTVELDQARVGRLSRMDALQGQAMAQETLRRHRIERTRIEAALRRLDDGSYGACRECGEPIAAGRLEADPTATLCLACAEAAERHD
ncbi:MAG: TraR/DksA C4-type zinc finger protein [Gammaproteobacteria bacterium]|nr:TraR/DksA C4-type zinc finger protein [Gammaproteobacteria bacterium]